MTGHVFILQGDLTELCCDDWLLPSDSSAHVTEGWWRPWLAQDLRELGAWCVSFTPERRREPIYDKILSLEGWDYDSNPRPWLLNIRGKEARMERISYFLQTIAALPASARHLRNRGRRLVALPVVGTGYGGSRHEAGKVLTTMVPLLQQEATRLGLDIALVTRTGADFTAGQRARAMQGDASFQALPEALRYEANELAMLAAAGRLVLFLGAGVSAGANLPQWKDLLLQLAQEAGFQEEEREAFGRLDALDQAEYLAQKLGGHEKMGGQVAALLRSYTHYSLAHGLLASTPFSEAVTTNYDKLFEQACAAASRPLTVLPYSPSTQTGQWLLKMHGCLDYPDDIVLTRQSYLRYAERHAALGGIVQAMLITKYMLFMGFSLSDENFLRIVDEVRRAVHPYEPENQRGSFGTAMMLFESPLHQTLWQNELHWACMGTQREELPFHEATRRFEMALDYLAYRASAQNHLLDPRFRDVLSPQDCALKELLLPLLEANPQARQAAAWPHVAALLEQLGGRLS